MNAVRRRSQLALLTLVAALLAPAACQARVKLVLLPQRENVRMHFGLIGVPLTAEERVVALEEGVNEVELTWVGLPIDPASVMFIPLTNQEALTTLSIAVPPSEQQSLVWRVKSETAANVRLRIIYVLSNSSMYERTDYKAIVGADEAIVAISGMARINNNTGLAQRDVSLELGDAPAVELSFDRDERRELPILDSIEHPVTKTYTSDSGIDAGKVYLRYEWTVPTDERAQVNGKARAFLTQEAGGAMDTFLGEDFLAYIPSGEECKLLVGLANDVEVERKTLATEQLNQRYTQNTNPQRLVLYDQRENHQITVKNHRPTAMTIALVEHAAGDWEIIESSHPAERKDATTFEFKVEIPGDGEVEVTYTIMGRHIHPE